MSEYVTDRTYYVTLTLERDEDGVWHCFEPGMDRDAVGEGATSFEAMREYARMVEEQIDNE